jgi:hypothetical protein
MIVQASGVAAAVGGSTVRLYELATDAVAP